MTEPPPPPSEYEALERESALRLVRIAGVLISGTGLLQVMIMVAISLLWIIGSTTHRPIGSESATISGVMIGINVVLSAVGFGLVATSTSGAGHRLRVWRLIGMGLALVGCPTGLIAGAMTAFIGSVVYLVACVLLLAALPKVLR